MNTESLFRCTPSRRDVLWVGVGEQRLRRWRSLGERVHVAALVHNYALAERALRQVHLGKRLDDISFSQRTHQLESETQASALNARGDDAAPAISIWGKSAPGSDPTSRFQIRCLSSGGVPKFWYTRAMARNTSITLGEEHEAFVSEQLERGTYRSASELVREALDLLADEQRKEEALYAALDHGLASGRAKPGTFERVRARVRAHMRARQ